MALLGGGTVSYERGTPVNGVIPGAVFLRFTFHASTESVLVGSSVGRASCVQGYLAHKKPPPRRTVQYDHAQAPMVVLGGGGGFL
jgi:hypothetical protein